MYSGVARSSYRQHCWSGRGHLSHEVRKGTPQRERSGIGRGTPQSANQLTAEGEEGEEEGGKGSLMREQVYTYSKNMWMGEYNCEYYHPLSRTPCRSQLSFISQDPWGNFDVKRCLTYVLNNYRFLVQQYRKLIFWLRPYYLYNLQRSWTMDMTMQ